MHALCALLLLAATALLPHAASAQGLAIRFFPAQRLHSYPLESARSLQGVVLQNLVLVNTSQQQLTVDGIELRLKQGTAVMETRRLDAAELKRSAASAAALQAAGLLALLDFQFGDAATLGTEPKLARDNALAPGELLLISHQFLSYQGPRDTLEVQARASAAAGPLSSEASLPIRAGAQNRYRFPLAGRWTVVAGPTAFSHHRWVAPQEFAFDIARFDAGNQSHRGDGTRLTDYHAYGAEVLAAADGIVRVAHDGMPEAPEDLRRPGEAQANYMGRVARAQMQRLTQGTQSLSGNHVLIEHAGGESSVYAHLQPGSLRVQVGQRVKVGQVIGKLGSSGNSTEPHLHFHVCDRPSVLHCAGVPVNFDDIELPYADMPRPLQTGDVVEALSPKRD